MHLYILDDKIRRSELIDEYESLIWTERWQEYGDFELVIKSTPKYRSLLQEEKWVAIDESYRVMIIETIVDAEDDEGRSMLTVTGRSLEAILEDRVAHHVFEGTDPAPTWNLQGFPAYLARAIFEYICVDGKLSAQDVIPFIQRGSFLHTGWIPEPQEVLYRELDIVSLYEAIQGICIDYSLGFRLIRNKDTSKLYFEVYTGSDRTGRYSDLPPVIFSPEMNSLSNASHLTSCAGEKNVAYVFSPTQSLVVYPVGVNPNQTGFKRRAIAVKVDQVRANETEAHLSTTAILQRRGREELVKHRRVDTFDGEIAKSGYVYGEHYHLGDLVEMRKSNEIIKYMRVSEQIFICDAEGKRSYPTLELERYAVV